MLLKLHFSEKNIYKMLTILKERNIKSFYIIKVINI